jgi:hypothetical protein
MKHIPSFKKLAAGGGLTLMCALSVAADTPNYLIEIDVSDLTKVTFTATTNSASVADSSGDAFDGIDLLDFFNTTADYDDHLSGDLAVGNTGAVYNDAFQHGSALNISDTSSIADQSFSVDSNALTGAATGDFSSASDSLPVAGASGDIIVGYSHNNLVLGQWRVIGAAPVPEVGTLALAGLGGLSLLFYLRWRK